MASLVAADPPGRLRWLDSGRVPGLDGLRAISILLVLVEHATRSKGFPLRLRWLGDIGAIGVAMFFGISGFLITTLLVREWNRSGAISIAGFYRRRALRILPAYVVFLAAVFALTRSGAAAVSASDWTAALTYTMNFVKAPAWEVGHVWSLSVEEQFYLFWPLLVVVLTPRRALWLCGAYLALAPVVRLVMALGFGAFEWIDYLTPLHLDAIAAGCLLALVADRAAFRERALVDPSRASLCTAAAAAVIVVTSVVASFISLFDVTLQYSVIAAANVVIIWTVATAPATLLGRILSAKPVVFVGVLAYSLYLWQQLFLNRHPHWWTAWPQSIVLALLAAVASYYVVESPLLRIKDRGSKPARAADPAPVSHAELSAHGTVAVG